MTKLNGTDESTPVELIPLVSVVIPTKNRLQSLNRLLDSIATQDYPSIEIIIVDDGSDIAVNVCELSLSFCTVVRNEISCGVSSARNRGGLTLAQGKFVLFLDDDTALVSPSTISEAVMLGQKFNECGIIGFKQLKPDGSPSYMQPTTSDFLCSTAHFFGYAFLAKRDSFQKVGGFNPEFRWGSEEIELSMRYHIHGYSIFYAPALTVLHYEDLQGRDVRKNQRSFTRNYILILIMYYPLWMGIPLGFKSLWRHLIITKSSGTDWSGIQNITSEILSSKQDVTKYRTPLPFKVLKNIHGLRVNPLKLEV